MRAFFDLLDNMTNTVRVIFGLFVLCMFGFGLMMTIGVSYVAPTAIEGMAEKAIEANERQVQAAANASRDRELAKDGWGYGSGNASGSASRDDRRGGQDARVNRRKDGWASE